VGVVSTPLLFRKGEMNAELKTQNITVQRVRAVPVKKDAFFAVCKDLERKYGPAMRKLRGDDANIWLPGLTPEVQFDHAQKRGLHVTDIFYLQP